MPSITTWDLRNIKSIDTNRNHHSSKVGANKMGKITLKL